MIWKKDGEQSGFQWNMKQNMIYITKLDKLVWDENGNELYGSVSSWGTKWILILDILNLWKYILWKCALLRTN